MLQSIDHLRGYTIHATDGELGTVDQFLFDDQHWTIRYLVVNTGNWLTGRLVLITPVSLKAVQPDAETLDVALTRQQVKDSPDIDTDQPVSRQQENALYRYYGYPAYWGGPSVWGAELYPAYLALQPVVEPIVDTDTTQAEHGNPHLRSTRNVTGYAIHARDGEIGHVEDFLVDDATWTLRYLIVDTKNWWPGKKVVGSVEWIGGVSWDTASVEVDLLRETIKAGAEYDPSRPFSREDEAALYQQYQQRPYWEAPERH